MKVDYTGGEIESVLADLGLMVLLGVPQPPTPPSPPLACPGLGPPRIIYCCIWGSAVALVQVAIEKIFGWVPKDPLTCFWRNELCV